MYRAIFILVCLFLFFCPGYAHAAGDAGANFLRLGIGAKNAAMGDTGAVETGANAINWNPAGLNRLERSDIAFTHAQWLDGISFQNVSFAMKHGEGAMGASIVYLGVPSIDKFDNTGVPVSASYAPSDLSFALSYARVLNDLPVGANLKYISSTIDGTSASAIAADVGVLLDSALKLNVPNLSVGLALQNIGTQMKFNKESFSLPLMLRAGAYYAPLSTVALALDISKPVDTDVIGHLGGEYRYAIGQESSVAGRLGYRTNTEGLSGLAGLTTGVGFGYRDLYVDYAFVPYGDLDDTHRVTLGYKF